LSRHQFFIIQNFEQLALALKNSRPELFHYLEMCFIFEQLALALKNRVCPEFAVFNIYFLSFKILNNLRLPWNTELSLNFLVQ